MSGHFEVLFEKTIEYSFILLACMLASNLNSFFVAVMPPSVSPLFQKSIEAGLAAAAPKLELSPHVGHVGWCGPPHVKIGENPTSHGGISW